MKCPTCRAEMRVNHKDAWESVSIRYLKCPQCGRKESSVESFRDRHSTTTPDMESEAQYDTTSTGA